MTLTPAVYREETGKWIDDQKVFIDPQGNIIWPTALIDGDGNLIGTEDSPLRTQEVVATDLVGLGTITVQDTAQILITDVQTRLIRIRASMKNDNGIVYFGKTGIAIDGSNDFLRLELGDEHTFPYNALLNPLYAKANRGNMRIDVGILL